MVYFVIKAKPKGRPSTGIVIDAVEDHDAARKVIAEKEQVNPLWSYWFDIVEVE